MNDKKIAVTGVIISIIILLLALYNTFYKPYQEKKNILDGLKLEIEYSNFLIYNFESNKESWKHNTESTLMRFEYNYLEKSLELTKMNSSIRQVVSVTLIDLKNANRLLDAIDDIKRFADEGKWSDYWELKSEYIDSLNSSMEKIKENLNFISKNIE